MGILPGDNTDALSASAIRELVSACTVILACAAVVLTVLVLLWRRRRKRKSMRLCENQEIAGNAAYDNTAELPNFEDSPDAIVVEKEIVFIHTDEFIE
jgi:hypothetical protein